jgi:CBS domain-containing protein
MSKHHVNAQLDGPQRRQFTKALLDDVRALEKMLEGDLFETGVRRIGAEQELFLVDPSSWRPAPVAVEVLERLDRAHFTTELGRFNLEFNLDPLVFGGDCLSRMERQVDAFLAQAREAALACGADIAMVGILPTLRTTDMRLELMTPNPRYLALNQAMSALRGGHYELQIQGVDELIHKHDTVMLEACNTSFQAHFQVDPQEFPRFYNAAQAVTAPVLAAATNSPLLFGRRLWSETRIALFEQSIDTRRPHEHSRQVPGRVSFGNDWIRESVLEIYREAIGRYKVILQPEGEIEDPFEALEAGRPPRLQALQLHSGTIYRWNRVCYGLSGERAHLRIENRVLPAGPTPADELANAAFWFGLVSAVLEEHGDVARSMDFADAKANFLGAASRGLGAQFTWLDGKTHPADDLITEQLVPLAREGLRVAGVAETDVERYMGIIDARVRGEQTGSQWLLKSLAGFGDRGTTGQRMAALTAAAVTRQKERRPVHEWPLASLEEGGEWRENYLTVGQFMTTDLVTVNEHEPVELVSNLMDWNYFRHVPVESDDHDLVGIVSGRSLLRFLANKSADGPADVPVSEVMQREPITVTRDTPTLEAIALMREERVSCLPVVDGKTLVGLITEEDFLRIASQLIEEKLRG